jgi:hypothetical protein
MPLFYEYAISDIFTCNINTNRGERRTFSVYKAFPNKEASIAFITAKLP